MLDFEQLAFIEKWRQRASRGVVVALDGTRGDVLLTMRVGEGSPRSGRPGTRVTRCGTHVRAAFRGHGLEEVRHDKPALNETHRSRVLRAAPRVIASSATVTPARTSLARPAT